jgi:hypothetical protein
LLFQRWETLSFFGVKVKRLNLLCDEIIDERNKRSFILKLKKRIVGKNDKPDGIFGRTIIWKGS